MTQKLNFHLQYNKACALLYLLSSLTSHVYGMKTHCTSAKVQIGESATLTCTYDIETSKLHTNIYVDHQQTSRVEDHELVVACQWSSEKFACKSVPDFNVVGDVTNQLTFRINEVLEKHAGNYTCDVLGSVEKTSCVLTVTGTINTSPNINKRPTNEEENGCEGSLNTCFERKTIIGLTVAVTSMIIILIAAIILLRRNARIAQTREDFKSQKSTPVYKKILKSLETREKDTRTLEQHEAV